MHRMQFFSNGTYGSGGSANLASMSALMGYKVNEDGSICSVPERFPENWYRRATPYGVLNGLIPGLIPTYAKYPLLPNPLSAVLNGGQINEIGCALKVSMAPMTASLQAVADQLCRAPHSKESLAESPRRFCSAPPTASLALSRSCRTAFSPAFPCAPHCYACLSARPDI